MELEFLSEIISKAIEIKNNVIGTINESDPISIIGAAAWIPAIVQIVYSVYEKKEIKNRRISLQLIDFKVFNGVSLNERNKYTNLTVPGSVVLIATNIFIPEKSFFVDYFSAKLKLCNINKKIDANIIGNVDLVKDKMRIGSLTIPNEYSFNLHREVICEKDNIRVFAFFIENYDITSKENIENITFKFKGSEDTKSVVVEKFNTSTFAGSDFLLAEECYRYTK